MSMYKPKELISSLWQPNIPSNISFQTPAVYLELIHSINWALCKCTCNTPSCYMCYDYVIATITLSLCSSFRVTDQTSPIQNKRSSSNALCTYNMTNLLCGTASSMSSFLWAVYTTCVNWPCIRTVELEYRYQQSRITVFLV